VQVLLAFLLVVPFSQRFSTVTPLQLRVYFAVLLCTAVAAVLLIAPSSHHPRRGVRVVLVRAAVASLARVASEWRSLRAPCILPDILTQKGWDPSGLRPCFSTTVQAAPRKGRLPVSPQRRRCLARQARPGRFWDNARFPADLCRTSVPFARGERRLQAQRTPRARSPRGLHQPVLSLGHA
jgi:hypothetical protein